MIEFQTDTQPVFRAISDPTRRAIIGLLAQGDMSVNEIVRRFDISRPGIAKHLGILQEGNLITVEPRGRERINSLEPNTLKVVADWLAYYSRFWDAALSDLKTAVETDL
jgi:DNA-binding transcriptional ArsR family regulator